MKARRRITDMPRTPVSDRASSTVASAATRAIRVVAAYAAGAGP